MFDTVDSLHWFSSENQFIWIGNPMDISYESKIFVGKDQTAVIFMDGKFSLPLSEGENMMCESKDAQIHAFFDNGVNPIITARVLYTVIKGTFSYDTDGSKRFGAFDIYDARKLAEYLVENDIFAKEEIMMHMFEKTESFRRYSYDVDMIMKCSHEFAEISGAILLPLAKNPKNG